MTTRRGFFRSLLGAGAAASSVVIGVDAASGEDRTMFNFTCSCGKGINSEVPKNIGAFVEFDCECGTHWKMEWMGDRFKTEMSNRKAENSALEDQVNDSLVNCMDGLRGRPHLKSVMDEDYEASPIDE